MSAGTALGKGVGDPRNLIAFLIAGFAGVLNVIGLRSAEIGVVLRNDSVPVTVISILLFLAIATATVSVFVPSNILTSVLLIAAILFTSIAAYGALTAETNSQKDAVAEIGDDLQVTSSYDVLTISIAASKLSAQDWLGVSVFGVPRRHGWNIAALCGLKASVNQANNTGLGCRGDPCYFFLYVKNKSCIQISSNVIAPDASGGVQRTLKVLVSPGSFKFAHILAGVCMPSTKPAGQCAPTGSSTRLDIAIPGPP
jgi:hypothetical protein